MYICDFGVEASLRACCRASLIPVCIVASLLTLWVTQLLIHETKLDSGIHNTPGVLVSCLCLERKAAGQTLVSLWGNVVIHIHMWWRARWLHRGLARGSCGRVLKPGFGAESVWMCVLIRRHRSGLQPRSEPSPLTAPLSRRREGGGEDGPMNPGRLLRCSSTCYKSTQAGFTHTLKAATNHKRTNMLVFLL